MKNTNLEFFIAAYKEKMKELSMLSLICSCFYPEPRNINIYTYDGEWFAKACIKLFLTVLIESNQ